MLEKIGKWLAGYLSKPYEENVQVATCTPDMLSSTLQKGDILLVEGNSRISAAIKYLTQSTWSHAAFYIGDVLNKTDEEGNAKVLVEADVQEGVRAVSLNRYCHYHTRICRPVGLNETEINQVVRYVTERIGYQYDLKNIFDLARYMIHKPPVPRKYRRKLLALGSGDPTRAICSSLIAQAYQSIRYPILPDIDPESDQHPNCRGCYEELLHIRHHSLFAPRDFDISPYFEIVKPTIESGFDPHELNWAERQLEPQTNENPA
ncbi:MAG: YiiX/YebB-like N1pC/P60 family cysteine hydrolase [Balneolaceae bacterium]|nr:YiiX/YebB-like N1pC/P60 family cysteine hydrolase [Balneolaceae bacterium]